MTTTVQSGTAAADPGVRGLRAYVRLAKLDVFDYYLGVGIVLAALPAAVRSTPHVLLTLAVFLAGEVFVVAAMVALDDITGFLDGSDIVNYGPDAPARRLRRKPLVAGVLTVPEARRFALLTALAGTACWATATALGPHRPLWVLVTVAVTLVCSVQYSWGLKLSYHGAQELFLAALGWAFVLAPFGLAAGSAPGFLVIQALIFGLGPVLFGVYSNTNDIAGDRSVGRITVASIVPPRGNALFIGTLSLTEAALVVVPAFIGMAPWWFPVLLSPVLVLRATQFHTGMNRGRILAARLLGVRIHRIAVLLLVVADLLHGGAR